MFYAILFLPKTILANVVTVSMAARQRAMAARQTAMAARQRVKGTLVFHSLPVFFCQSEHGLRVSPQLEVSLGSWG